MAGLAQALEDGSITPEMMQEHIASLELTEREAATDFFLRLFAETSFLRALEQTGLATIEPARSDCENGACVDPTLGHPTWNLVCCTDRVAQGTGSTSDEKRPIEILSLQTDRLPTNVGRFLEDRTGGTKWILFGGTVALAGGASPALVLLGILAAFVALRSAEDSEFLTFPTTSMEPAKAISPDPTLVEFSALLNLIPHRAADLGLAAEVNQEDLDEAQLDARAVVARVLLHVGNASVDTDKQGQKRWCRRFLKALPRRVPAYQVGERFALILNFTCGTSSRSGPRVSPKYHDNVRGKIVFAIGVNIGRASRGEFEVRMGALLTAQLQKEVPDRYFRVTLWGGPRTIHAPGVEGGFVGSADHPLGPAGAIVPWRSDSRGWGYCLPFKVTAQESCTHLGSTIEPHIPPQPWTLEGLEQAAEFASGP